MRCPKHQPASALPANPRIHHGWETISPACVYGFVIQLMLLDVSMKGVRTRSCYFVVAGNYIKEVEKLFHETRRRRLPSSQGEIDQFRPNQCSTTINHLLNEYTKLFCHPLYSTEVWIDVSRRSIMPWA